MSTAPTSSFIERAKGELRDFLAIHHVRGPLLLLHHADPDGACAAALLSCTIRTLYPEAQIKSAWIGTHQFSFDVASKIIRDARASAVVCLDLNFTSIEGGFELLAPDEHLPILVYDDHQISYRPAALPRNVIFLNPNLESENIDYPAAIFAYDAGQFKKHHAAELVASIGLFADHQYQNFAPLRGFCFQTDLLFELTRVCSGYYLHAEAINSNDPVVAALEQFLGTDSTIDAALNAFSLEHYSAQVSAEVELLKRTARAGSTIQSLSDNLVFVAASINSPHRVVNLVASSLRNDLTCGVVSVAQQIGQKVVVELRRTKKPATLNLKDVLEKITKRVAVLNYGGHAAAAGLSISPGKVSDFEAALKEELTKFGAGKT